MKQYQNEKFKALKYNLYGGYELIYANHSTLYSRTISNETAAKLFSFEKLNEVSGNYNEIDTSYYGQRKTWNETPI